MCVCVGVVRTECVLFECECEKCLHTPEPLITQVGVCLQRSFVSTATFILIQERMSDVQVVCCRLQVSAGQSRNCSVSRVSLWNRKALRTSRAASQTDDVHLCIMCLRAIMNYQVLQSTCKKEIFVSWRPLICLSCLTDAECVEDHFCHLKLMCKHS